MTYRGKIQNGVVVLEGEIKPPEGAAFTLVIDSLSNSVDEEGQHARELSKILLELASTMRQELPTDASRNVDHYLYGHPKR